MLHPFQGRSAVTDDPYDGLGSAVALSDAGTGRCEVLFCENGPPAGLARGAGRSRGGGPVEEEKRLTTSLG